MTQELRQHLNQTGHQAKRPSCLDLVTLLRKQLADHPVTFPTAKAPATYPMMVGSAAA